MIDFACREFNLDDVVKCSLGLTKSDFKLMRCMMTNNEKSFTTFDLARKLGLDLSTVQRSVKKLNSAGVIIRRQINLNEGGYEYSYTINEKKKIRQIIIGIVRNWTNKVELELEGL